MSPAGPGPVGLLTLVHGRREHLARQHASLALGRQRPEHYLVVAMDDPDLAPGSVDGLAREVLHVPRVGGRLPLAAARNAGVAALLERGAEVVVALDVDCLAGPDLVAAYAREAGARPRTLLSGPVTYLPPTPPDGWDLHRLDALDAPHPARPAPPPGQVWPHDDLDLFWSLSFALSADAWRASGGFCEDYTGYGGEDTDFARTARAAGLDLAWVGAARAYHQHHPVSSPPVEHLDDILRNGATYARRWGTWPMRGWLEAFERAGLVRRTPDGTGWQRTP